MTPGTPSLDLVVIGGLTVDHFADGSSSPGGTVMHAARATAARGNRIGVVTAAGAEPAAQAGLAELRRLGQVVDFRIRDHSATFRHEETVGGRRLWLERTGGPVELDPDLRQWMRTRAVLYGPVLGEVPATQLAPSGDGVVASAILQGWLRSAEEGEQVRPLPLAALGSAVVDALAGFDLLVASREDLVAEAEAPRDQLAALRGVFGPRPHLIVTDGADGLWHDAPFAAPEGRHHAVPQVVETTATVGAGDILAAILATSLHRAPQARDEWIAVAMRVVAEVLEARSG
jgi:sugar/nucleoside kinase (ribokinase family)